MKKDNKNKTNELFEAFLPDRTKDDPNENLKKEKKLFSVIFIVVCTLLLVANLIAMIVNFSTLDIRNGLLSLFVGFINCTISIFLLGLLIVMAHNLSKMTRATLYICSKLMRDEKRLQEAEKKKSEQANIEDNQNEKIVDNNADSEHASVDVEQVNDFDDTSEEVTTLSVDIIADED